MGGVGLGRAAVAAAPRLPDGESPHAGSRRQRRARALRDGRGAIDWFIEYGQRGERHQSEFFEEIWRVGISLTGSETWARRRQPEEEIEDW
jgi:hypothetical protein